MKRRFWLLCSVGIGIAIAVGLGLGWRNRHALLLRQDLALQNQHEHQSLQREHTQLAARAPSDDELTALRAAAAEAARLRAAISARPETKAAAATNPASPKLADGTDWTMAAHWRNRGNATVADAVETSFWAASNGELSILRDTIELSPGARAKADEILARLPADARARYSTPEDLAALFTARDASFQGAQLVYNQRVDDDHAQVAIIVKADNGRDKEISLALHRFAGAWRLVMPADAMNRIGAELSGNRSALKTDVPSLRGSP